MGITKENEENKKTKPPLVNRKNIFNFQDRPRSCRGCSVPGTNIPSITELGE